VLNAVDVKTKGYYGYQYYGSRKGRPEKGADRGATARRPGPEAAPPAAEVTNTSIL